MNSASAQRVFFALVSAFVPAVAGCGGVPGDGALGASGAAQKAVLHLDAGHGHGDPGDKEDGGVEKGEKEDGGVEIGEKEDGGIEKGEKEDGGGDKGEKEDGGKGTSDKDDGGE
jgi:hypothetical protein